MTQAQQRRVLDVLAALDDCVSNNGASYNLVGITANLRKVRKLRRELLGLGPRGRDQRRAGKQ